MKIVVYRFDTAIVTSGGICSRMFRLGGRILRILDRTAIPEDLVSADRSTPLLVRSLPIG